MIRYRLPDNINNIVNLPIQRGRPGGSAVERWQLTVDKQVTIHTVGYV